MERGWDPYNCRTGDRVPPDSLGRAVLGARRWRDAAITRNHRLAANAITHGRVAGRDFRLTLQRHRDRIRVEVTDARPECGPPTVLPEGPAPLTADSGRGLLLVAAYAEAWGCESRDVCTKTVWAEISCPDA
ncbi:ATP-binding protein [Streptomyces sp. NBC_00727]|uniref:ATP-binding protein n=1 Tax=Streptomyces sp. NBC_00727 TaxID=2903675 RepID=UPI00386838F7